MKQNVIVEVDRTYSYFGMCTNRRTRDNHFALIKNVISDRPALFVTSDGFILNIQGPYWPDSQNNDAQMLIDVFEQNINGIRAWFQEADILRS